MALTVSTKETGRPPGAEKRVVVEVTFDSSYAEGGESFKPSDVGLAHFSFAPLCFVTHGDEAKSESVSPVSVYYSEEKLHVIDSESGKELAKEKNLEKFKALVVCFGH